MRQASASARGLPAYVLVFGLLVTASAPQAAGPSNGQARPPTFRSGVELITVDTTVIDKDGRPVAGLRAEDFDVQVDGKPRRVVSADLVRFDTPTAAAAGGEPEARLRGAGADSSSNEDASGRLAPERTIILAFDHGSFTPLGAKPAVQAARKFLDTLNAADRVAFAAFPQPDVFLAPTSTRTAIVQAMDRLVGTAATSGGLRMVSVSLSEAVDIYGNQSLTYNRVFDRECRSRASSQLELRACETELSFAVRETVLAAQERARRSVDGLSGLLNVLRRMEGRKILILVSAGLFSAPGSQADVVTPLLRDVADAMAAANVAVHVLHIDTGILDAFSVDRRGISETVGADISMMAGGLENIAGVSGGALSRVVAGADFAFARISREHSAVYVLAVEPDAADRDGRPHRVTVKVSRPGVQVRSRQQFTMGSVNSAAATPEGTLAALLQSGRIARDLPLRVGTLCLKDARTDKIRVLVRADVGRGVDAPASLKVALAMFDHQGRVVSSTVEDRDVVPGMGPQPSWPYLGAALLSPGTYTLRVAVVDPGGRTGSVAHRFDARLGANPVAEISDVLVFDAARYRDAELSPVIDGRITSATFTAFVEVYPRADQEISRVEFAVSGASDPEPLVTRTGKVSRESGGTLRSEAVIEVTLLPPGEYQVTATAFAGKTTVGRSARAIAIERVTVVPAAGAAAPPRLRFTPGEAGALGRAFVREDVLRPEVLSYFLDRLKAVDPHAGTSTLAQAVDAAGRGDFERVTDHLRGAAAGNLTVPFLRGLAKLAQNEPAAAATDFLDALEIASDFLPAAFYLGACYAIGGQDVNATGAWQTALISEAGARVIYDVLADAYLRMRQGDQALAILDEARSHWPDDDLFLPRLAVAQSITGSAREALQTLDDYLTRHPDDDDTLLLTLRLLYDAHAGGAVIRSRDEDVAAATRLASQYRTAGGAQAQLVDRWVAFMQQGAVKKHESPRGLER